MQVPVWPVPIERQFSAGRLRLVNDGLLYIPAVESRGWEMPLPATADL